MIIKLIFKNFSAYDIVCIQTLIHAFIVGLALVLRSSLYHEIGHAIAIRYFDKEAKIIIAVQDIRNVLRVQFNKKTKITRPRICTLSSTILKRLLKIEYVTKGTVARNVLAEVVVEHNFRQFKKEKEVRTIVKAGRIAQTLYVSFVTLITGLLFGNIIMTAGIIIMYIITCEVDSKTSEKSKTWSDARILKDTKGYMEELNLGLINEDTGYCYHKLWARKLEAKRLLANT